MAKNRDTQTPNLPTTQREQVTVSAADVGKLPAEVSQQQYAIFQHDPGKIREIMSANLGQGGLRVFDLDRVKVPAGGGTAWGINTLEGGEQAVNEVEGIILHWRQVRRYFAQAFTGQGVPPDCYSDDDVFGIGNPGGACAKCPLSQFGSARDQAGKPSKGQACKQRRQLLLLMPGEFMPVLFDLPPTSLQDCSKYFLRLSSRALPFWGVRSRLTLEAEKNATGIKYSAARFSLAGKLSDSELKHVHALRTAIAPLMGRVIDQGTPPVAGNGPGNAQDDASGHGHEVDETQDGVHGDAYEGTVA